MPSSMINRVMTSIHNQWDTLESYLNYPSKSQDFFDYLENYRGLSIYNQKKDEQDPLAKKSAEGVFYFFANIFKNEGLLSLDIKDINFVLNQLEKNINLALYYWFGLNDRNYQFRTWIHYFGLEGHSFTF